MEYTFKNPGPDPKFDHKNNPSKGTTKEVKENKDDSKPTRGSST